MKSVGIICEYNPFHNGHMYHIEKIKEMFKDHIIICVMSGYFTQRGDVSIISKVDKTTLALQLGVDIVIELPYAFSCESADKFASASIEILNSLRCDYLVFGSESNNIKRLEQMADIQLNNNKYNSLVKKFLELGINYPTALSKALLEISGYKIDKPNDILGITYIREIKKLNSRMIPICIKRNNDYNGTTLCDNITSATSIRYNLENGVDVSKYVPKEVSKYLNKPHFSNDYFKFLKYKIMTEIDSLDRYQTVDEGIENRIKKHILKSKNLDELILKIKTKRYTYSKLNRMFNHILCNFTKEEASKFKKITYIRILGFNFNGQNYLNQIKKDTVLPLVTNFKAIADDMFDLELRVAGVYSSILNEKEKVSLIESEYKDFPIIR